MGIPADFVVAAASVQASASAAGDCVGSTWVADGTLIADGKINLKRPGGMTNNRLCPGAALTLVFSATSAPADGTYIWVTELLRGAEAFVLSGSQPTVQVDGISPAVTIGSHPANPSNVTSPSFGFSATEPASFQCKLDGGSLVACTSPKSYNNLADGSHTFTVKATDAAGNAGEATYGWTTDTVPPTTTITQKPPTASNNPSPTFGFAANEFAGYQCKLDAGAFVACTSPHAYSDISDGPHTFTVKATDAAGNAGEATYGWRTDTIPPSATITQKPNNPSNVKSPTFAFSASEAATFQCKLDTGAFVACTSPHVYSGLVDGPHTFTVRATDAAGNAGEATYGWLLETNRPIVTLTQKPTDPSASSLATFTFEPSKLPATLQCRFDGGAFAPCVSPAIYTNLGDGPHTFAVRATDAAGNTGPETIYGWTIDTAGPTVAITQKPGDPTNSPSASFEFVASEPATFQCKLDDAAFTFCAPPQAYGNLAEGRHTFVVRAGDALSNLGPETLYAWTKETRAPAVAVRSGPAGLGNRTSAALSFSADEPSTFQCNLDDRGYEPCSSPASYAGLRDGSHVFAVRATDLAGNVGAASHAWAIDATAPQTTLDSSPASTTTATSAAFAFSGSEPATFQCRLDSRSFSSCRSPKTYTGLARGMHRFVVRAIDTVGNVEATPPASEWKVARKKRTAATSALFAPAGGARVTGPPLLRWRTVTGAAHYNVQLYRAGRKVLTKWPTRSRLQLRARWTLDGRVQRLKPGLYRWYVWPGFRRASKPRYGQLLGTSTFVVRRAA